MLSFHSLCPAMSWVLCLWIAVSCLVLCQATLYETIQQHHVPRPGQNAIQILGESHLQLFSIYAKRAACQPSSTRRPVSSASISFFFSCWLYFVSCGLYGLLPRACSIECLSKSSAWFEVSFRSCCVVFSDGRVLQSWHLWLRIGCVHSSSFLVCCLCC